MSSRGNLVRGGAATRSRGDRPPATQGQKPGPTPQAFPPGIPASIRKHIGGPVKAIRLEYTEYGVQVFAVFREEENKQPMLLEDYLSADKAEKASRLLREERTRYQERVEERQITGVQVPAAFNSRDEIDRWLRSLSADNRRLISMTNRDFRAQQGTNDDAATAATTTA